MNYGSARTATLESFRNNWQVQWQAVEQDVKRFEDDINDQIRCNRLPALCWGTRSSPMRLRDRIDPTLLCLGYGQILSHRLRSSGSTFMYLFHLISIDLELSRSFNTHTLQSLHQVCWIRCQVSSDLRWLYLYQACTCRSRLITRT
jgi:hypothetical protein